MIICVSAEADYFLTGPPETKCFTDCDNQLVFEKTKPRQSLEHTGYKQTKLQYTGTDLIGSNSAHMPEAVESILEALNDL